MPETRNSDIGDTSLLVDWTLGLDTRSSKEDVDIGRQDSFPDNVSTAQIYQ